MTGQLTILIIALLSVLHFTAAQNSPQDYINAHNRARAAVGVGRMRWDNRVAAFARDYGNKIKANCDFKHSGGPYGENLAFGRPDITGTKSVQMWVDEKKFYNCRANRCTGGECGHYTQVVWKDSTKLGCARVKCNGNKGTIVICNYSPPGNFRGRRPYTCRNSLAASFDEFIDQYV
ncbi:Pathogenesis-related protein 1 [Linum grandiflorum]